MASLWWIFGLGTPQLVAWGALYYAIAVLGEPMRVELGVPRSNVFGAFTCALVVAGLLGPWAGRQLDRHGGRVVLAASAVLAAVAFACLSQARSVATLAAGWSIAGVAMALGLYDACFAAIGQAHPSGYRSIVSGVTLVAGFASTVSLPLSHHLLQTMGWRSVCHVYALALALCAPIYLAVLPASRARAPADGHGKAAASAPISHALRARIRVLSCAFAGAALIGGAISAHVVEVLTALRLSDGRAVWIAASIGALQVFGRVLERAFGARLTPVHLGLCTFIGLALAMLALAASPWASPLIIAFTVLYGVANGLLTIAKATIPVEILGFANVGATLGSFSAPALVARAMAPFGFALLAGELSMQAAVIALLATGFASLGAFIYAKQDGDRQSSGG